MKILTEWYRFEIPDKWNDLVKARKKKSRVDLVLAWDEELGYSGRLVSLRCLKRKITGDDENTELLGNITGESGDKRYLYATYGKEGDVSEDNEDLYFRLVDQLWRIYESIEPANGYSWTAV